MKNIKFIILFVLLFAFVISAQTNTSNWKADSTDRNHPRYNDYENYKNEIKGFEKKMPQNFRFNANRGFSGVNQSRGYESVLFFGQSPYEQMNSVVQPEDAKKDLDIWFEWLHSTHPDVSYTVKDIDKFYNTVTKIKDGVNSPITVLEFWRRISVLNSQLSDGHLVVGNPGADYLKDYLARGGTLFPFEVIFNNSGLVITHQLGGNSSDLSGYTILKINNVPIETIVNGLLIRMNGDSDEHRKALLQKKFAYFFMLLYGESKQFEVTVMKDKNIKNISIDSSKVLPFLYKTADSFADNFQFKLLDSKNALLTINTFGWDKKEDYFDFMKSAFSSIKSNNIQHLIIDIRDNSGGDDDMWMKGILKYMANKPYRWGSKYHKKIIAKYRDAGQVIGQVVEGEIESPIPVDPDSENRFEGRVSILIGHYTYSSAILFANTVQDYGFGKLVGEATGGKSGQTGGIQFLILPNTRLRMVCPRFYLERPNGGKVTEPVKPDIEINYEKTKPSDLVNKLIDDSPK